MGGEGGGVSGAPLTHRVASRPSDVSPREFCRPRGQPYTLETKYSDIPNPRLHTSSVTFQFTCMQQRLGGNRGVDFSGGGRKRVQNCYETTGEKYFFWYLLAVGGSMGCRWHSDEGWLDRLFPPSTVKNPSNTCQPWPDFCISTKLMSCPRTTLHRNKYIMNWNDIFS